MKRLFYQFVFVLIFAALILPFGETTRVEAASGTVSVAPSLLKNIKGVYKGGVASLAVRNQTGTQDSPGNYILFQTPGAYYKGYAVLNVPVSIPPATVTSIKININYKGLPKIKQRWTWSLYDWNKKAWVFAGDNTKAKANTWSLMSFTVQNAKRFVRSDGRIQVLIQSNNSLGDAKIDQLKLAVSYATSQAGPAFPRLGMWWPDPWVQSHAKIARYDFVELAQGEEQFIAPIKKLNPNIKLLTATNACELAFSPDHPTWNDDIKNIPAEWFLTQVGTTLSAGVDAAQTNISVNAMTVSNGTNTYDLFVAGDTVLIEGESMLVNSVDKINKILSVQRGYIRPASSHAAGTRIAAHITFWPGSWLMNLSTLSAKAIYDVNIGAESWAEYNARVSAQQLIDVPGWDGILIDRSDGNQSWLIGNSTARTIDPDQSNTLPTDYSQFDSTWNDGLRILETNMRAKAGTDKIIYTNWGYPNYDLLNGTNLEGFPRTNGSSYGAPWHQTVFGPRPEVGSYFDWMKNSPQPNLTMVETYEDDNGPDPSGNGQYTNPYTQPGFTPDYRKMRFGLGTALLNDGYFSYEINTNGHGSLGLMWFDEYDNAGAGRGYLGYPLGNAARVWNTLSTPNLVSGGGFNSASDFDLWSVWADTGYAITGALDSVNPAAGNSSLKLSVTQAAGTDWQAALAYESFALTKGKDYNITFKARADAPRQISLWAQKNSPNWNTWLDFGSVSLTTNWQTFSIPAPASGSDSIAALNFGLGQTTGTVWIDDVKLQQGALDVWRRDFQHGIVLVNATNSPVTVPLGGTFRKINGTQVPTINNGATVTSVTIQPLDAIILLRP